MEKYPENRAVVLEQNRLCIVSYSTIEHGCGAFSFKAKLKLGY